MNSYLSWFISNFSSLPRKIFGLFQCSKITILIILEMKTRSTQKFWAGFWFSFLESKPEKLVYFKNLNCIFFKTTILDMEVWFQATELKWGNVITHFSSEDFELPFHWLLSRHLVSSFLQKELILRLNPWSGLKTYFFLSVWMKVFWWYIYQYNYVIFYIYDWL